MELGGLMSVEDLSDEQKSELKQQMLIQHLMLKENRTPSWGELADANDYISDEELIEEYESVEFSEDDFWST